jgi:hypothetical protein
LWAFMRLPSGVSATADMAASSSSKAYKKQRR